MVDTYKKAKVRHVLRPRSFRAYCGERFLDPLPDAPPCKVCAEASAQAQPEAPAPAPHVPDRQKRKPPPKKYATELPRGRAELTEGAELRRLGRAIAEAAEFAKRFSQPRFDGRCEAMTASRRCVRTAQYEHPLGYAICGVHRRGDLVSEIVWFPDAVTFRATLTRPPAKHVAKV